MATTRKTTATKEKTTAKKPAAKVSAYRKSETGSEQSVFERAAGMFHAGMTPVDIGGGITVDVRSRIGLGEAMALIMNVVDICVDEEKGEVHYEVFDYAMKMAICAVYCDIEAPEDMETGYAAVCGANRMYDMISGRIDKDQLQMIWDAAKQKLDSKRELFNSAAAKIVVDMLQRINELYEMLSNMSDDFNGEEAIAAIKDLSSMIGK